ncbi:MAG: EpsI family protein [Akkermansiaceae bacterium]
MKLPVLILPLLLGGAMATIHLLPEAGEMAPSAVKMDLPARAGDWVFRSIPPSQEETNILAPDTRFSKAICLQPRAGEVDIASGLAIPDRVDISIVLSGHDLNNSIHRPERCMPSQGHVIGSSSNLHFDLKNGRSLTVRRLLSVQSIPINEEKTEYAKFDCVTYYFFVGHDKITQDHLKRTLLDMKDRLLLGMDQRWAYVSTSMWYGKVPWIEEHVPLEEADAKLRQFISDFAEEQIDWDMIRM